MAPSCSRICWMNWSQQHSQTVPVQPQVKDPKKKPMRPLLAYGGPITPIATPEFIFVRSCFSLQQNWTHISSGNLQISYCWMNFHRPCLTTIGPQQALAQVPAQAPAPAQVQALASKPVSCRILPSEVQDDMWWPGVLPCNWMQLDLQWQNDAWLGLCF